MKITDEFIGQNVQIVDSPNKQFVGLSGKIVDETKNSFKIKIAEKIKIILKKDNSFKIKDTVFKGEMLLKRPEDRIKLKK